MGTSKGYQPPSTPQWGKMKGDVTRQSRNGAVTPNSAKGLFRTYIRTTFGYGDSSGPRGSSGGGSGGGGGGKSGKSAISTARKLAGFANAVAGRGVDQALLDSGLGELVGKPAEYIISALVDHLTDPGTTLDQVDVRGALDDLWEKLLNEASTYEEVKIILEENLQVEKIGTLLFNFFSNYLYRHFCRSFFERIRTRHGELKTEEFLTSIKEFIASALENFTFGKDLARINWVGDEGRGITEEVFANTLQVFGE
jgi:hypothetical protein